MKTEPRSRRVAPRSQNPEVRTEDQRIRQESTQVNAVMRALDSLRVDAGMSKAELAREIGRNDAVVRRLFTAVVNPELRTVAALAGALGAEIQIVPRPSPPAATPNGAEAAFLYGGRTLAEWVPDIVERIAQRFDPERIVLFGSLARGEGGRDSDIDLLVIFRAVADKRAMAVALRRAVADVPAPVDFVVTDRAEIRRRGRIVGPALGTALREGRVVYTRGG